MDSFIGQILLVGFNYPPVNFMLCQGQLLSIRDYTALFSLLGTAYGGDGVSTFALPNLCGRTPIGTGQSPSLSPYFLGQAGGTETNTLLTQNLNLNIGPGIQHVMTSTNSNDPLLPTVGASPNLPMNNMPPYLALNYIICVNGYWPPRQ